ncbi:gamma-glutamyltransferase [Streptomyces sp. HNM0574]|uniref:gamma-glutamyltransferase family protein n=1 Tax=Streptomyces sp. HNM0574 TaxID=2714954 RepID=UPI0019D1DBF7|nr:gamma-glutamyltransferase [Streptomyces sp. HNM0574]
MVSSTHWLASQTAMAVLEDGGNAYDAAVAAGFVLHVVEPHLNGPAGEVPALLAPAGGPVRVLCGQGVAPAGADVAHYTALGLDLVPGTGPLAAAVPGAFDAWMLLLRDYGTRPLATVLDHAIGYAERGHPVVEGVGRTVETVRELLTTEWTDSAALYLPDGRPPAPGTLLRNPALAATWRRLLAEAEAAGPGRERQIEAARRIWREGFVAEALLRAVARPTLDTSGTRHTGTLTGDDLARWEATYEEPASHTWGEWTVCKAGPWSQGPVLLQQLALLGDGPEDLAAPEFVTRADSTEPGTGGGYADGGCLSPDGAAYVHRLVEGTKLAMADREAWYGDADGAEQVPLDALLSPRYSAQRRALIGETASRDLRPGRPVPDGPAPRLPRHVTGEPGDGQGADDLRGRAPGAGEPTVEAERPVVEAGEPAVGADGATRGDTCHLDVVDRWGNMISATPSGGWLHSNPVVPELGFPLGTRLQMTWLEPGLPNTLTPGRRPRTTLTPSLALRGGEPVLAFGTPGGDQQDQWQLHFFLAAVLRPAVRGGLDLQGAVDAPNWHTDAFPGSFYPRATRPASVTLESRAGEATAAGLRRRGHEVTVGPPWSEGRLCAVTRDPETGVLAAAANPRGMQGYAVGR